MTMNRNRLFAAALALVLIAPPALAQEPGTVDLPLEAFLKLYEANRAAQGAEKPPRDYAIAAARYQGEVLLERDVPHSALFTVKMRIESFKAAGWARIPVLPATVALQSAKIGAVEASVVIEDDNYTLITGQRGAIELTLTFAVAVTTSAGKQRRQVRARPRGRHTRHVLSPSQPATTSTSPSPTAQASSRTRSSAIKRVVEATLPADRLARRSSGSASFPKAARQQSARLR
jgi:hypothetical protein